MLLPLNLLKPAKAFADFKKICYYQQKSPFTGKKVYTMEWIDVAATILAVAIMVALVWGFYCWKDWKNNMKHKLKKRK